MEEYIKIIRVCYLYHKWKHTSIGYSPIFNAYKEAMIYAKKM